MSRSDGTGEPRRSRAAATRRHHPPPCCFRGSIGLARAWPPACPSVPSSGPPCPRSLAVRRTKLEQELQADQLSDEQRAAALADHEQREREFSRLQRQRLCMEDFEPLRLIGKGAFGEVRICRDRSTGQLVAVKKLKKAEMVRRGQVGAGAVLGRSGGCSSNAEQDGAEWGT